MKISFYTITKEEYERTEYRPLDRETTEIETEPGWTLGDVIENDGKGYAAEMLTETRDGLKVWHVYSFDLAVEPAEEYLVELSTAWTQEGGEE